MHLGQYLYKLSLYVCRIDGVYTSVPRFGFAYKYVVKKLNLQCIQLFIYLLDHLLYRCEIDFVEGVLKDIEISTRDLSAY